MSHAPTSPDLFRTRIVSKSESVDVEHETKEEETGDNDVTKTATTVSEKDVFTRRSNGFFSCFPSGTVVEK